MDLVRASMTAGGLLSTAREKRSYSTICRLTSLERSCNESEIRYEHVVSGARNNSNGSNAGNMQIYFVFILFLMKV